jgi:hypothetical protein
MKSSGAGANVGRIGVRFGSNSYLRDSTVGQESDQDRQRSGQTESRYLDLGPTIYCHYPSTRRNYVPLLQLVALMVPL